MSSLQLLKAPVPQTNPKPTPLLVLMPSCLWLIEQFEPVALNKTSFQDIRASQVSLSRKETLGKASLSFRLSCSVGVRPNASSARSDTKSPSAAHAMTPPPKSKRVRGVRFLYEDQRDISLACNEEWTSGIDHRCLWTFPPRSLASSRYSVGTAVDAGMIKVGIVADRQEGRCRSWDVVQRALWLSKRCLGSHWKRVFVSSLR